MLINEAWLIRKIHRLWLYHTRLSLKLSLWLQKKGVKTDPAEVKIKEIRPIEIYESVVKGKK